MEIFGTVESGLGKGKVFLSQRYYQDKLYELLGVHVFAGTLNIRVDVKKRARFLSSLEKKRLEGMKRDGKEFGGAYVYPCVLNDTLGAVIVPDKTAHPETIIEFVCADYLREKLVLTDGDSVCLTETKEG